MLGQLPLHLQRHACASSLWLAAWFFPALATDAITKLHLIASDACAEFIRLMLQSNGMHAFASAYGRHESSLCSKARYARFTRDDWCMHGISRDSRWMGSSNVRVAI